MRQMAEGTAAHNRLLEAIDAPLITRYIPLETIKQNVLDCGVQEKRLRRLPMWIVALLCIVRGVFAKESWSSALARLCLIPCLKAKHDLSELPDKSALCLARYRLGARPLVRLFKQVCRPVATPQTPGAYDFGYRLVAIDTTYETVADSGANEAYFGRHRTKTGKSDSAFPLCQAIYLSECSTHIIFDAAIMPFRSNQHHYCKRMLRSVEPDMLVMLDSGLLEFGTLQKIVDIGAQFILPAKPGMKLTPITYFEDGSYLAEMRYWKNGYCQDQPRLTVRVIAYTLDDPTRNPDGKTYRVITRLLDPTAHPADEIIILYHQRWEIELAIDEIDTHQRLVQTPFRSQKPVGVIQEFYALLLAYFIIGCWRHESAEQYELSPQQLSFINGLRLIEHVFPIAQWLEDLAPLNALMYQWHRYFQLPPRDNRINPRVVKRKMSKFRRKKPEDVSVKVPAFEDTIRILQRA